MSILAAAAVCSCAHSPTASQLVLHFLNLPVCIRHLIFPATTESRDRGEERGEEERSGTLLVLLRGPDARSGWRRGAPIRCRHTPCLRMPLAGGEGSCAQNQPHYSHSPYRSRAESIIRFERLGAVITSSQKKGVVTERKSGYHNQPSFVQKLRVFPDSGGA